MKSKFTKKEVEFLIITVKAKMGLVTFLSGFKALTYIQQSEIDFYNNLIKKLKLLNEE